ncbi:MAG: ornithine cyclodeaminase family protein [Acidobacteriota bacterium]|nr:ornithine cyclodeaminase family protein [Acidobacteriota bacterium]
MALYLTESDVRKILTMPTAIELVERSFQRLAAGSATNDPRRRLQVPGKTILNYMAAADSEGGYLGLKIYSIAKGGARFIIPLISAETGEMAALIEADYLGQLRTGAASGVATKFMARADAHTAAIIGTGSQARTQLEAIAYVRNLDRVRAYGRDARRRQRFAAEMSARIKVAVEAVGSAEEAVRGADVICTATTAATPVVEGRWIARGAHINAIGINVAHKREIDAETVNRADLIAADSPEQSRHESGDLIGAFGDDSVKWETVRELAQIVAGKIPGRTGSGQITLFKSNGIAIEDVVTAGHVYEIARKQRMGKEVPVWRDEGRAAEGRGV